MQLLSFFKHPYTLKNSQYVCFPYLNVPQSQIGKKYSLYHSLHPVFFKSELPAIKRLFQTQHNKNPVSPPTILNLDSVTHRSIDKINDDAAKQDHAYQTSADTILQILYDQLEQPICSDAIESVEINDGVLEICLTQNKGIIIINKHYVYRQIWYSSPYSGPDYFDFETTPPWTSQRSFLKLNERLAADIKTITGVSVSFKI